MKAMMKTISGSLAAATLALAVPAAAQMELYKDYEPADEVVELTFVKVDAGQLETYLEGLKSTWVAANEMQKKLGYVTSYAIYAVPYGDNEFNMVLRVSFPNTEMLGPNKVRYMKFLEEYGKTKIDQSNKTVLEVYNSIRTIQGTYILREMKIAK
jgi:hypothetical protein